MDTNVDGKVREQCPWRGCGMSISPDYVTRNSHQTDPIIGHVFDIACIDTASGDLDAFSKDPAGGCPTCPQCRSVPPLCGSSRNGAHACGPYQRIFINQEDHLESGPQNKSVGTSKGSWQTSSMLLQLREEILALRRIVESVYTEMSYEHETFKEQLLVHHEESDQQEMCGELQYQSRRAQGGKANGLVEKAHGGRKQGYGTTFQSILEDHFSISSTYLVVMPSVDVQNESVLFPWQENGSAF